MRSFTLVLVMTLITGFPAGALSAPTSSGPPATLSAQYPSTLGDAVAATMAQLVPVLKTNASFNWRIDGPMVFTYNRVSQKVVVSVYGEPSTGGYGSPGQVDKAKAALEYFRTKTLPALAESISQTYGLRLEDSDLTLVYINRGTMKEVIRREGEKYLVSD